MKMVKSVYTKILENVPDHMPETGGMLGGQNGIVTKIVFDDGKEDDFRRCHYTPNVVIKPSQNHIYYFLMTPRGFEPLLPP